MYDDVIKNNGDVIILITCVKLKSLLKSKDVLYQVSSDLGEVHSLYSSFSVRGQKARTVFKEFKKPCLV